MIVVGEVGVEVGLHLLDGLVPLLAAGDAKVLIEQGKVQALDEAIALRALDQGGAVLDLLELEEELVGVANGPTAELPPVVGEHRSDAGLVLLEGRQHVVVDQVHGGDRDLVGVEPGPGLARVGVDGALQLGLAGALEGADEEGVDGHQVAPVPGLDVTLAKLRAEAFQQANLLVRELGFACRGGLLQAQQALLLGQEARAGSGPRARRRRRPGRPRASAPGRPRAPWLGWSRQ